jgi:hypothetical protein
MALAALTDQLRKQLTLAAALTVADDTQVVGPNDDDVDWEESTLHEAIESDRRLTTRNVVRWLDQLSAGILACHRAYISVGDFGVTDVKVGHRGAVASSVSYAEAFTAWLKLGNDAVNCRYDTGDPSLCSGVAQADGERIAVLDFHRRVRLHQQTMGRNAEPRSPNSRLPKAFECQNMLRFDFRHDNNISIP